MWDIQELMNFKTMQKIIILLLFLFPAFFADAQSVLLEEDVDYYEDVPEYGHNRKHYYHFYGSYGHMLGSTNEDKSKIAPFLSQYFDLGMRYKRRFSQFYSMGYDIIINNRNFRLADDESRNLPADDILDKESINLFTLEGGLYSRFNVDSRRGNYIGDFLDIGVFGGWNFLSRYYYKHEFTEGQNRKFSAYNPDYLETFNYGAFVRAGYNRYVLFARYRLSNLINTDDNNYEDLPAFNVGVQVGFHK